MFLKKILKGSIYTLAYTKYYQEQQHPACPCIFFHITYNIPPEPLQRYKQPAGKKGMPKKKPNYVKNHDLVLFEVPLDIPADIRPGNS
jgi:hypothetical protein